MGSTGGLFKGAHDHELCHSTYGMASCLWTGANGIVPGYSIAGFPFDSAQKRNLHFLEIINLNLKI